VGDWLQGPHVYALYESYSMSKHEIEILFITGFGSSMLFGTIIGSFADKYGRRFNCILYGILYGAACLTKHFNNFYILMFGRLLAGISTSILYSAFESWLIYEHKMRGFDELSLSHIFANSYLGNSIVAILAGIFAQYAADMFGYVAPFDLSFIVLILMSLMIIKTWNENYGDNKADFDHSFKIAFESIKNDKKIFLLGITQSLFESSMYIFVLEWTPALTIDNESNTSIPHGFIFASFMIGIMIGSNIFKILIKRFKVEEFMCFVFGISSFCLFTPVLVRSNSEYISQSFKQPLIFTSFVIFEICVGIFWPSLGTMRGVYLPEDARSTIMNFFRIPLNLIVVLILYIDLRINSIFKFCTLFLITATISQYMLLK
jgi:MFS transporter, MFS domain-containing protein family, molybdate-anion transporter